MGAKTKVSGWTGRAAASVSDGLHIASNLSQAVRCVGLQQTDKPREPGLLTAAAQLQLQRPEAHLQRPAAQA